MNPRNTFASRALLAVVGIMAAAVSEARAAELRPPGFRPVPPGIHALVGGRVFIKPGEAIEAGVVVVRDGVIQTVGTNLADVPAEARVWDLSGKTLYAGFIEPYFIPDATNAPLSTSDSMPIGKSSLTSGGFKFYGAPGVKGDAGRPGPGYPLGKIMPEFRVVPGFAGGEKTFAPLRELGFTAAVVTPARGIIRGTSAFVLLSDEDPNRALLRPDVFQHIAFETDGDDGGGYPGSLMGVIAAVRQSFLDAQFYERQRADFAQHPQHPRPEYDPSLGALADAVHRERTVVIEAGSILMDDRAARLAGEFGLDFALVSCGQEWRRPDLVKQAGGRFIVPVNFPTLPKLPGEDDWDQVSLDQLRAWDWAAENPALLRRQGNEIALTTYGLADRKDFRGNLRLAVDRGLSETDALAALTTVPAKLCGVEKQLGTIEPGKLANFVVVDGKGYFDADAKVREVWVEGRIYRGPVEDAKSEAKSVKDSDVTKPKEAAEHNPQPSEVTLQNTNTATSETNRAEVKVADTKKSDQKADQLRTLQKTRVAKSPLDGRGPLASPARILIRNAMIWTGSGLGIMTNAQMLVSD
ncbi:MAG: amidohydrolase family protein, partial [Verrucomicrobiota bacterium]